MFASYEVLMRQFRALQLAPGTSNFLAGGLSSTVFWTGSFCFDAVKNRLMSDSVTAPRYAGWLPAARQIYAEGGVRAFYRGASSPLASRRAE